MYLDPANLPPVAPDKPNLEEDSVPAFAKAWPPACYILLFEECTMSEDVFCWLFFIKAGCAP